MNRESEAQVLKWFQAGLLIPLAAAGAESGWKPAALLLGAALILYNINGRLDRVRPPTWLCLLRALTATAILGSCGIWLSRLWNPGEENRAVTIILLLLAGHTCTGGTEKAARVGAVLWRLLVLGGGLILFFGVAELKTVHTYHPQPGDPALLCLMALTMLTMKSLDGGSGEEQKLLPPATAVLMTAFAAGQTRGEGKLHQWVSGLTVNGKPLRMEVLLSVLMTLGWYALFTLQLTIIRKEAEKTGEGKRGVIAVWGSILLSVGILLYGRVVIAPLTAMIMAEYTVIPGILTLAKRKKRKTEKGVDK